MISIVAMDADVSHPPNATPGAWSFFRELSLEEQPNFLRRFSRLHAYKLRLGVGS